MLNDDQIMKYTELKGNPSNPRYLKDDRFKKLKQSIEDFPEMLVLRPIVIDEDNMVLGGNMRLKAIASLVAEGKTQFEDVPVTIAKGLTEKQKKEFIIKDNIGFGEWDWDILANEWDSGLLEEWGLEIDKYDKKSGDHSALTDKFLVPPFSVLDTKQEYWIDRRNKWLSIGIQSELGRQEGLTGDTMFKKINKGTSIFDPVLCEVMYLWFNKTSGSILDPFAGGSVRGVVAEKLGYKYTGIELSRSQVNANKEQATAIGVDPIWINGDSNIEIDKLTTKYDMVFSCPPYEDLEVYSNDSADISNMSHDDFNKVYRSIIQKTVARLNNDCFAVWVVGEVRNKSGFYNLLVPNTIRYFEEAGANFYNEIILLNSLGTLPIRAARAFQSSRKVGKCHQNVLVFYKGDIKNIKTTYGEVDVPSGDWGE